MRVGRGGEAGGARRGSGRGRVWVQGGKDKTPPYDSLIFRGIFRRGELWASKLEHGKSLDGLMLWAAAFLLVRDESPCVCPGGRRGRIYRGGRREGRRRVGEARVDKRPEGTRYKDYC